ncbi:MAG: hypothetical protein ACLR5H_12910 [Oscillospiraceae bacterium]
MKPDDLRIPESFSVAKEQGLSFVFHPAELREAHPNTAVLTVEGASGKKTKVQAASIGGGRIRVDQLDGVAVDFTGIFNTPDRPSHGRARRAGDPDQGAL